MNDLMNAICLSRGEGVKLQTVPNPPKADPGHLLIKMTACAINPGDKAFITQPLPMGAAMALHNVYGVSGAGAVVEAGDGVPPGYKGKNVAVYRSLKSSESMIGTWCEYAHLPFLDCVILPDNVDPVEYSGSLVNTITPYAFLKQSIDEGHQAIISTAGTSATGIAMVGICLAFNFPLISIVRSDEGKKELESLGATNVIVQADGGFNQQLKDIADKLNATAIFDGVGGELLNHIIEVIPNHSTIYSYGYLGGAENLTFHAGILNSKDLTIKSFGNFRSATVQNPERLHNALKDIAGMIASPHFKTKTGGRFGLEEINDALLFTAENGAKAMLCF